MIFCVEDDAGIRNMMMYTLASSGFEAEGFQDGEEFFEAVKRMRPELVILDIMLPGDDGLEILRKLRSKPGTTDIPVIMATAKGTEYDKVIGLDMGADDYLVKPFGMMEMVSRVKAVLRRSAPPKQSSVIKKGKLELNADEYTVTANGERIKLTLKEYEMLKLFMENPGRVFTREQLLEQIWDTDYLGETRTVDVHIGTIRTKLGECGEYIKTVRGVGYRMEEKI